MQWVRDWLLSSSNAGDNHEPAEPASQVEAVTAGRHASVENAAIETISSDESSHDFVVVLAKDCRHLTRIATPTDDRFAPKKDICESRCCRQQCLIESCDEVAASRTEAHLLESCGRGDHNHSFVDLRSASQAIKRHKSTSRKYYDFKYIKPGDLEASQRQSVDDSTADGNMSLQWEQTATNKTELYRLAQLPPRPPQNHHRHIDKVHGTLSQRVDQRREHRKHGKAILNDLLDDCDDVLDPHVAP